MDYTDLRVEAEKMAEVYANNQEAKHPLYDQTVKQYRELAVHYIWGTDPGELIKSFRPSETKFAYDYRLLSYEQTTYSIGEKIIGLQRGVLSNDKLYSIKFPDSPPDIISKENIKDYLVGGLKIQTGNIETFYWEFLFQMILIDPNGFIAIVPYRSDEASNPDEYRKPYPVFIPSENVMQYSDDYLLALSSDTKTVGGEDKAKTGHVYFFFTNSATLKCEPFDVDDDGNIRYTALPYHEHNLNVKTFRQVGGIISGKSHSVLSSDPQAIHLSHLMPTLPALNRATKILSDLDSLLVNTLHPIRYGIPMICNHCKGDMYVVSNEERVECPVCSGAGTVIPTTSPLEGYTVPPDEKGQIHAPVNFVSPPLGPFTEAKEFYYQTLDDALISLDMDLLITKSSGVGQTARAKEIDREPLHAHFRKISNTIFPLFQWVLDSINILRYGSVLTEEQVEQNRVEVNSPIHFDTTKINELMEDIKLARDNNFPIGTRKRIAQNYISKTFGSGTKETLLNLAYLQLDPFALMTDPEQALLTLDSPDSYELKYLHSHLEALIEIAIEKYPNFLEMNKSEKLEKLLPLIPTEKSLEVEDPIKGTRTELGDDVYNS